MLDALMLHLVAKSYMTMGEEIALLQERTHQQQAAPLAELREDKPRDSQPERITEVTATEAPQPSLTGIAGRISYCESGGRNSDNPVSSASGYFQFIDSTWSWVTNLPPPAKAYSYEQQKEAFLKLWDEGRGASHWQPSRYCWVHEEPWNHYDR